MEGRFDRGGTGKNHISLKSSTSTRGSPNLRILRDVVDFRHSNLSLVSGKTRTSDPAGVGVVLEPHLGDSPRGGAHRDPRGREKVGACPNRRPKTPRR